MLGGGNRSTCLVFSLNTIFLLTQKLPRGGDDLDIAKELLKGNRLALSKAITAIFETIRADSEREIEAQPKNE